jgi:DinB family protein
MTINWTVQLHDQLDWHWRHQLRPGLDGLTDDEYLWEPVDGCWSVRPGADGYTADFIHPEPVPPPVTTIAWRLAHLIVGVLGVRAATHFAGPTMDYHTFPYAGTADEALAQLDAGYARWSRGVAALGDQGLARPCGPAEGPLAEHPLAALVLHINREVLHHGAEIMLLRDLHRRR